MADKDKARRAGVRLIFDGTDISEDIRPYLKEFSYTDNEEDECDDLSVTLQDREGIWLESWAFDAIYAAAAGAKISGTIIRRNWTGKGEDEVLDCGEFELDAVTVSSPPSVVTLSATSLPYNAAVRKVVKNAAWEACALSEIAGKIASRAGLTLSFLSETDPYFEREEQYMMSDIAYLSALCHRYGLSLKTTDGEIVIFEQADFEAAESVGTIRRGDRSYIKYSLESGEAKTKYGACKVSYEHPDKGLITSTFTDPDAKSGTEDQVLVRKAKVNDAAEAETLAKGLLRLANKFETSASFTVPGNPLYCAGMTVTLEGFGEWDGGYMIRQAVHVVSATGGYTTTIQLRKVLNGY